MNDNLTVCYHAVSETWPSGLCVTPRQLEQQIRFLLEKGYVPTTFTNSVHDPPADRTLAVTFDDAYLSVFELAFPILERLGVPATVFAPTNYMGAEAPMSWPGIDNWIGGEHEAELTAMGWDRLAKLAEAGWEIGSHSCSHSHLPRLDNDALSRELSESRAECERKLGRQCLSIAYPFGEYDDRVVTAAAAAGYRAAGALPHRFERPDPLRWPRVDINLGDQGRPFRLKVSPTVRRVRATPAWTLLRRARHAAQAVSRIFNKRARAAHRQRWG